MTEDTTEIVNLPAPTGKAESEIRALKTGGPISAIVPTSYEEAYRMAQAICGAGLAPDSYKSDPKKVVIGIMAGMEVGVAPLQALSGIAIINGRPAIWGDLAVALCQSKGQMADQKSYFEGEEESDAYVCIYQVWRIGQRNPYEGRFSIADAKKAKLWGNATKQPWIMYPKRMLFNRARAFALRNGFADHLKGLAIREEVEDMTPQIERRVDASFLDDAEPPSHGEIVVEPPADVEFLA